MMIVLLRKQGQQTDEPVFFCRSQSLNWPPTRKVTGHVKRDELRFLIHNTYMYVLARASGGSIMVPKLHGLLHARFVYLELKQMQNYVDRD